MWKSRIGHFGAQELSNILLAFTRVQLYNQELLQVTPNPFTLTLPAGVWLHWRTAKLAKLLLVHTRRAALIALSSSSKHRCCC